MNHFKEKARLRVFALFLCYFSTLQSISTTAHAAEGGYTNYIPGTYGDFGMALAPTETWTLRNDLYFYDASGEKSVRNGRLELSTDLQFLMNFTTVLYKPEIEVVGGTFATGIFFPLVGVDIDASLASTSGSIATSDRTSGIGDIVLIPFAIFWNRENIHTSFSFLVITPTGSYSTDNLVNNGLNYWSFDTNFALTYLNPESGFEASCNLGYIYNSENQDTDYQSGQELHFDVALNQYLSETFGIGIHGYFLKQITGDRGSGALLGDFKGEAAGLGPALMWTKKIGNQDVTLIAKWLHEMHAENRLEGDSIFLTFAFDW